MEDKAEWHILTVTEGGTVSLLKNLTEEVARKTMQNLRRPFDMGDPWSDWAIHERVRMELSDSNIVGGFNYSIGPGDLKQISCFGPEGQELVVWPKPDDYEERYQAALKAEREKRLLKAEPATPPPRSES